MERYRSGDAAAFRTLLDRYGDPLFGFIYRHVGNRAQAEDIVQDVFLRVVKHAERWERRSKFSTWIYTIARNACVDAARRKVHRRHPSLDQPRGGEDERTLGETIAGDEIGGDRRAMDSQFTSSLEAALASLPEEQREVFVLRQFQQVPFQEIAKITETPVNTVKSRMRYALESLRLHLAEFAP